MIDRGTRGINWTLSSMVFNVVPTFFEVSGPCTPELRVHHALPCDGAGQLQQFSCSALASFVGHGACVFVSNSHVLGQRTASHYVSTRLFLNMVLCVDVLQVAMVSAILTVKCGASLAALTCGTLAAYMAFTFSITQVLPCSVNRFALRPPLVLLCTVVLPDLLVTISTNSHREQRAAMRHSFKT